MNSTSIFCLDPDYLNQLARNYHETYINSQPFPHIVFDNFLPELILEKVRQEFPQVNAIDWQKFEEKPEKKLASKNELQMGEMTRILLYQLNSSIFLQFLETLTGIDGLIPDPYFEGGGLHQIERGGYLKIHADFNWHSKLRLDRRLNVIIYLNKNWQEEYGGHLQLWDKSMSSCVKKILPIFNRCVIFNTTDFSYHGHPEPLNCPEGQTRKSLALYYYSNGRPPAEISRAHSTLFWARPGQQEDKSLPKKFFGLTFKTALKKLLLR